MHSFAPVALMFLLAALAGAAMLFASRLLGPKRMTRGKAYPYECGMPLLDGVRRRFGVHFYLVAALFILFDIEVAFLLPWALVLRDMGRPAMAVMLVFLGILFAGSAYLWKKGAFDWSAGLRPPGKDEPS
jgi:NADH-quinone oxidoreductase subunit A